MNVLSTHISDKRGTDALKRALADIDAPGYVVAYGDRRDMLMAALDAHYAGKKILHVGAGETSHWEPVSHPDHRTRDAISMLAEHVFVANEEAAWNVAGIGFVIDESVDHEHVHVTGCPSLDEVVAYAKIAPKRDGDFSLVHINPMPTDAEATVRDRIAALEAHNKSELTRGYVFGQGWDTNWEHTPRHGTIWPNGLGVTASYDLDAFLMMLARCGVYISNSSAVRREAPILGTPCIEIGGRQAGRASAGTYHHPEGKACEEIARICKEVCK